MVYGTQNAKTSLLRSFTDAYWAGSVDNRKSTSGAAFFLGDCLRPWLSKKQHSIALYTTEVEYIVVA